MESSSPYIYGLHRTQLDETLVKVKKENINKLDYQMLLPCDKAEVIMEIPEEDTE